MAFFMRPSPRRSILADWAKFTNREPVKIIVKYLFAKSSIVPSAPIRLSNFLEKITPNIVITVSYTHLDVYKRQVYILVNDMVRR